jgi:hypothetical protein
LPETAFDGLLKALNRTMGSWRPGAALHRVVLFTDASAKDASLSAQVAKLASNIGATISRGLRSIGTRGSFQSFSLTPANLTAGSRSLATNPDAKPLPPFEITAELPSPDPTIANVEIYTSYTGNSGSIDPDLKSIALSTGGQTFNAPEPDDLVKTLFAIIDLPSDVPTYRLSSSATEIWEGDRLSVSLATTNVNQGGPLYWAFMGAGLSASDFSDGITTGAGVVGADGRYAFSRVLAVDSISDPNETLEIKIFIDASRSTQIGSTLSVLTKGTRSGVVTPLRRSARLMAHR